MRTKINENLLIIFVLLLVIGIVMMSSMSVAPSIERGDPSFFFHQQMKFAFIGLPIAWLAFKFPLNKLQELSVLGWIVSVVLLTVVLFVGTSHNTIAKSWIPIGGFTFQPVEVAKVGVVIMLAALFANHKYKAESFQRGFIPFLIVLGIPATLVILQPDFGSLLILVVGAAAVYFCAGANYKHLSIIGGLGTMTALLAYFSFPFIKRRIDVYIDQLTLSSSLDISGAGYQIHQGMIAIGSGGTWGTGFGKSIQRFNYLPEIQSDTIFSGISEEMGFVRIIAFVGLYLALGFIGLNVAQNSQNDFQKYLAVGLTSLLVGQAFINIGVNLALLPNTGITLPFISHGGTSLIISMGMAGLLLNISQFNKTPQRARL